MNLFDRDNTYIHEACRKNNLCQHIVLLAMINLLSFPLVGFLGIKHIIQHYRHTGIETNNRTDTDKRAMQSVIETTFKSDKRER